MTELNFVYYDKVFFPEFPHVQEHSGTFQLVSSLFSLTFGDCVSIEAIFIRGRVDSVYSTICGRFVARVGRELHFVRCNRMQDCISKLLVMYSIP